MRPRRDEQLIIHELDDELLLYDPRIDRTHRLNRSASIIWQSCTGERSVEDIASRLTEAFDVEIDTALPDTQAALQQMISERLIIIEDVVQA